MKKFFIWVVGLSVVIYSLSFAGGLQTPVPVAITNAATYTEIAITASTTAKHYKISSRGGYTWYFGKTAAPGSNYDTLHDGESLIIGFSAELQGPYTFGYAKSSVASDTIVILPFDERE